MGQHLEYPGVEFAMVQNQHHTGRHDHEHPRMDEPGQRRQAKIVRPQAQVELVAGARQQLGGALGEDVALLIADVAFGQQRRRAQQHGGKVVLAHAPAEREEGVDEHHGQQQQLELGHAPADRFDEGQLGQQRYRTVGSPQRSDDTGQDDQRAGGEERGIAFQVADHAGIGDAVVALQHAPHPVLAVQGHDAGQARRVPALPDRVARVAQPAEDEPEGCHQLAQIIVGQGHRHVPFRAGRLYPACPLR